MASRRSRRRSRRWRSSSPTAAAAAFSAPFSVLQLVGLSWLLLASWLPLPVRPQIGIGLWMGVEGSTVGKDKKEEEEGRGRRAVAVNGRAADVDGFEFEYDSEYEFEYESEDEDEGEGWDGVIGYEKGGRDKDQDRHRHGDWEEEGEEEDEEKEEDDEEDWISEERRQDQHEHEDEDERDHRHHYQHEDQECYDGEERREWCDGDDDDHHRQPHHVLDLTIEEFTDPDAYLRLFPFEDDDDEEEEEVTLDASDPDGNKNNGNSDNLRPHRRSLLLALVTDRGGGAGNRDSNGGGGGGCRHSAAALERMEGAARILQHLSGLRLGVLRVDPAETNSGGAFQLLALDRFPALLFVTYVPDAGSIVLIEYAGPKDTSRDVAGTARHYWHRLVAATDGMELSPSDVVAHVKPPTYRSTRDAAQALARHGILHPHHAHRSVLPPLPPGLSLGEARVVRWLLAEERDEEHDDEWIDAGSSSSSSFGSRSRRRSSHNHDYSLPDDAKVFVQCRTGSPSSSPSASSFSSTPPFVPDSYQLFDQASRALSSRRDCFFAAVRNCDDMMDSSEVTGGGFYDGGQGGDRPEAALDGSVWGYSVPYDWDYRSNDLASQLDPTYLGGGGNGESGDANSTNSLMHNVTQFARPSVLWFDRQLTAPVVFGLGQRLHAVLVVDVHPQVPRFPGANSGDDDNNKNIDDPLADRLLRTREVVHHYRRQCRQYRQVACLIVPSTETRVLVTLGVDIWSPLDERVEASRLRSTSDAHNYVDVEEKEEVNGAESGSPSIPESVLPVVFLTDRERVPGKTLTYRLDADRLQSDPESSLLSFFCDFARAERPIQLVPTIKSDPRGPRTNAAGVRILTGKSVSELDSDDRNGQAPHALVLFVASTCGHCKRAVVIWNRLSEFLRHVCWDFVRLYLLDVMENEVPDGVAPKWLPDAYYYQSDRGSTFTRFDWIQDDETDDHDQGDTSSASKDSPTTGAEPDWDVSVLLDWFLSVANLTDSELTSLLDALEET